MIYAFVNGSKPLYGPEKIARKYLKGPKSKGGIAGIDVKTFVGSIVLKHFSKAMKNNRILRAIQSSLITEGDSVQSAASKIITQNLKANSNATTSSLNDLINISGFPLSTLLKRDSHAWRHAVANEVHTLYQLQEASRYQRISRTHFNLILRQIPNCLALLVRSHMCHDSFWSVYVVVDGVFVNALSVQNKVFQGELKALNRVTEIPKPSVRKYLETKISYFESNKVQGPL